MLSYLRLCRPYYALPMSLTFLLTVAYAGGPGAALTGSAAAATAALALVIAAAYVLNDVADVTVDRLNAPDRPLAAGRVRRGRAAGLGGLLMAGGLALGLAGGAGFAAALAAVAGGLLAYDVTSKRLGWAKPVVVAALMTSIYPLALAQAGGAAGPRAASLAVFPAWMFLTAWGYELLKDIRDAGGDLSADPRSRFSRRLVQNPARWPAAAGAAILLGAALLVVPCWLGCGWVYAAMLPLPVGLAGLSAWSARRDIRRAIVWTYAETVAVGLAATADLVFA